MRRFVGILAVFAILATATVAWRAIPNQASTLSGAWLLASVTDTAGNVNEAPQPGLAVITGTHYGMMYVNGNERRERYPGDSPTNTERLAAYNTFIANSGSYEVDGDQLTFHVAAWLEEMSTLPPSSTEGAELKDTMTPLSTASAPAVSGWIL